MDTPASSVHRARRRQLYGLAIMVLGLIIPSLTLARWPAAPSGLPLAQQAYVKASNTGEYDFFGSSIAVSGDTVVVGAGGEASKSPGVNGDQQDNTAPGAGAAYVFVRTNGVWSQQAYLKPANPGASDAFGTSVAISGDTIVVGAPREDGGTGGVNGGSNNNAFDAGAAYVFVRTGTTWSQQAYLKAATPDEGDQFGWRVAIDGDSIIVGAYLDDSAASGVNGDPANADAQNSGAAYVFARAGTTWSQQAYLKASNTGLSDQFGYSVSISGDTALVSALNEASAATGVNGNQADNSLSMAGAAYVFTRSGSAWSQQAYLKASNTDQGDLFGLDVAVSGETIVIGAPDEASNATAINGNQQDNSVTAAGAAYVFVRSNGIWSQQAYLKHSTTRIEDRLGWSVSISGDMILASGASADSAGQESSGAAYVFVRTNGAWAQAAALQASNAGPRYAFGYEVAAAPDLNVVSSNGEKSAATGINGNQLDTSLMSAGAAYFFADPATLPPTGTAVFPTHSPATQTALAVTPSATPTCAATAIPQTAQPTSTAVFPTHSPATQTALAVIPSATPTCAATAIPQTAQPTGTAAFPTHSPATQTALAVTPSALPSSTATLETEPTGTAVFPTHSPATQTALAVTPSATATSATPQTAQPTSTATSTFPTHSPATQTALAVTPSAPPAGTATTIPATTVPTGTQTVPNTRHTLYLPLVQR